MEKAKDKPPEFFKTIKTSLKSVLKHPEINTKILNVYSPDCPPGRTVRRLA